MKLILLGAPGAGKGTQAEKISAELKVPAISTGYIIRNAISADTELGKLAKDYIAEGKLVPDDIIIQLISERLKNDDCKNGFILDGFPRTINQAKAFDTLGIGVDLVINIEATDEVVIERLSGRRECSKCGRTYHLSFNKPSVDGVCDACGGELKQRKDDNPETIKNRLVVYHEETEPLVEYYESKGLLETVYSQDSVEETTNAVFKLLKR